MCVCITTSLPPLNVDALIKLIKAFSGCKITWIGDACFSEKEGAHRVDLILLIKESVVIE